MEYNISVTDKALLQIKILLEKRKTPTAALRLGIKGSGCNGFSYALLFEDDKPRDKDLEFIFSDIRVIVDCKSIIYLNGSELDFQSSLIEQGFIFKNPNVKSECGCKKSFSI